MWRLAHVLCTVETSPWAASYLPAEQAVQPGWAVAVAAAEVYLPAAHTSAVPEHAVVTVADAAAWNLPATHSVQTVSVLVVPAVAVNLPATQTTSAMQRALSVDGKTVPVADAAVLYVPVGQALQTGSATKVPTVLVNWPAAQTWWLTHVSVLRAEAEAVALNLPPLHCVQMGRAVVEPAVLVNLPAAHTLILVHESVNVVRDETDADALNVGPAQALQTGCAVVVPPLVV